MISSNELILLTRALRCASEMIAENAQLYDELKTADDWFNELLNRAKTESAASGSTPSGSYRHA